MKKYQRNQTYVVSGETFNEIADAVNWTHENQARLNGPDAFNKSFQNGEIRIKYLDSGTLPIFSAVALTGLAITPRDSKFVYNTPTLNANKVTTSNEKSAFAICAEPANSGKLTKAVLTGIIPAKVTINDATHEFAKPTPGGAGTLESCETGTARIIWKAGVSGEQWCILQLGTGSVVEAVAPADDYAGIFKMRALSSTQLEIVHGTYPGANYCGHTDVPGLYEIPRTALEVTAPGRQEITLQFFYDRDARRYSFRFCAGNVPEGAVFGIFLGYFRSGSVTQAFRYNTEQYIFGNDWYLR